MHQACNTFSSAAEWQCALKLPFRAMGSSETVIYMLVLATFFTSEFVRGLFGRAYMQTCAGSATLATACAMIPTSTPTLPLLSTATLPKPDQNSPPSADLQEVTHPNHILDRDLYDKWDV